MYNKAVKPVTIDVDNDLLSDKYIANNSNKYFFGGDSFDFNDLVKIKEDFEKCIDGQCDPQAKNFKKEKLKIYINVLSVEIQVFTKFFSKEIILVNNSKEFTVSQVLALIIHRIRVLYNIYGYLEAYYLRTSKTEKGTTTCGFKNPEAVQVKRISEYIGSFFRANQSTFKRYFMLETQFLMKNSKALFSRKLGTGCILVFRYVGQTDMNNHCGLCVIEKYDDYKFNPGFIESLLLCFMLNGEISNFNDELRKLSNEYIDFVFGSEYTYEFKIDSFRGDKTSNEMKNSYLEKLNLNVFVKFIIEAYMYTHSEVKSEYEGVFAKIFSSVNGLAARELIKDITLKFEEDNTFFTSIRKGTFVGLDEFILSQTDKITGIIKNYFLNNIESTTDFFESFFIFFIEFKSLMTANLEHYTALADSLLESFQNTGILLSELNIVGTEVISETNFQNSESLKKVDSVKNKSQKFNNKPKKIEDNSLNNKNHTNDNAPPTNTNNKCQFKKSNNKKQVVK